MDFSTSEPELWRPRGFFTLILIKGNQGAFLPWNRSCDDQGVFLPRSWWKVTKGLFYLRTGRLKCRSKGFSTLIRATEMSIKEFFYFDLVVACKMSKFGIRLQMMRALWSHYFWDVWFPLDLIYFFSFLGRKLWLIFAILLKKILSSEFEFEIWNLKFGILNLRFWKLKLWNFNLVTYNFFLIQLITYDHDLNFYYNKKHTIGKGNQWVFYLRTEAVMAKGFFYLDLDER